MSTKLGLSIQIITLFSDQNIIKDAIQHLDTASAELRKPLPIAQRVFTKFPRRNSSCIA